MLLAMIVLQAHWNLLAKCQHFAQQFLSKFGATVSVTFSEPDSNGIVYPISASLAPEGGISGTIAAVLQLITGLGVGPGSLQKVLVEATPEGLITAGKNILAGKDQTIMSTMVIRYLELFNLIYQDPRDQGSVWWYGLLYYSDYLENSNK